MPRFTEQYIKQLKPRADRYDVTETGVAAHQRGLQCRVFPSGAKTWLFRYTKDGRAERIRLGTYPIMDLKAAHKARDACRDQLANGQTPKEARAEEAAQAEEARRERERANKHTVTALADHFVNGELRQLQLDTDGKTWIERKKPGPVRKSWQEVKRIIDKDITPAFGARTVTDIKPHELADLLIGIRDRGAPIGANRAAAVLKQMFSYAVRRGWLRADENPVRDIGRPTRIEPPRDRALDDDEIRHFWTALDVASMLPMMRCVYRLILTTGCRPGEATRAEWAEFNLTGKEPVWTIPAARAKNGREHNIPLAQLALAVLADLQAEHGLRLERDRKENPQAEPSRWLFPAFRKDRDTHIEDKAAAHAIRRNREFLELPPFAVHDLRRSVRTGLARLRVDAITAKKLLNHKLEGMDAVYDVHPYTEEKREALTRWCKHLETVIKGTAPKASVAKLKPKNRRAA
jgi:integrase